MLTRRYDENSNGDGCSPCGLAVKVSVVHAPHSDSTYDFRMIVLRSLYSNDRASCRLSLDNSLDSKSHYLSVRFSKPFVSISPILLGVVFWISQSDILA